MAEVIPLRAYNIQLQDSEDMGNTLRGMSSDPHLGEYFFPRLIRESGSEIEHVHNIVMLYNNARYQYIQTNPPVEPMRELRHKSHYFIRALVADAAIGRELQQAYKSFEYERQMSQDTFW